jgi:hypothetical protein
MGIKTGVMEGAENTPGNGIPLTSLMPYAVVYRG